MEREQKLEADRSKWGTKMEGEKSKWGTKMEGDKATRVLQEQKNTCVMGAYI